MKQFCCGDVVPGCQARFWGETDHEILSQVSAHAREAHGLSEVSPELAERACAAIS